MSVSSLTVADDRRIKELALNLVQFMRTRRPGVNFTVAELDPRTWSELSIVYKRSIASYISRMVRNQDIPGVIQVSAPNTYPKLYRREAA